MIKKTRSFFLLGMVILCISSCSDAKTDIISEGAQPQISTDKQGNIRVVFGQHDKVFCATSTDQGVTFSAPVLVAQIADMHLGMSRGPQIASSDHYSIITAMDKQGNIHWYRLLHESGGWKEMGEINDLEGSAPEGLMSITADGDDNFYAVWLDTRLGKKNQIFFSSLLSNTDKWSENSLAYQSPDEHVCECCKPSIAVRGSDVAIMFRNWLNGSRDLYLVRSSDKGQTFGEAQKLGKGTWKLDGCPMDGGDLVLHNTNLVQTTWQRDGMVYYCEPGQAEISLGKGRNSSISGPEKDTRITLEDGGNVKVIALKDKKETEIGKGGFLQSVALADNHILYIWEQDNKIMFKKIRLFL